MAVIYSVDDINQWVYITLNKLQSGEFSATYFNEALKFVNAELFRYEAGAPEGYQPGKPETAVGWQVSNTISDDLRPFITTVQIAKAPTGLFPYPANYAAFSSLWYDYILNPTVCGGQPYVSTRYIEPVSDDELRVRLPSTIKQPDNRYPVAAWMGTGFQVYPQNINSVELTYLRFPNTPVWGFTQTANGQNQYNPSTSVQPEWPDIMIPNFAARVAKWAGINIREEQFVQWMESRIMAGT